MTLLLHLPALLSTYVVVIFLVRRPHWLFFFGSVPMHTSPLPSWPTVREVISLYLVTSFHLKESVSCIKTVEIMSLATTSVRNTLLEGCRRFLWLFLILVNHVSSQVLSYCMLMVCTCTRYAISIVPQCISLCGVLWEIICSV